MVAKPSAAQTFFAFFLFRFPLLICLCAGFWFGGIARSYSLEPNAKKYILVSWARVVYRETVGCIRDLN